MSRLYICLVNIIFYASHAMRTNVHPILAASSSILKYINVATVNHARAVGLVWFSLTVFVVERWQLITAIITVRRCVYRV